MRGTCSSKLRGKKRSAKRSARRVRIGVPDGSLTALAGLAAVDEVTARLGIVGALDRGIGPTKQRDRGLTGGQLLLGMATAQLAGQDCLAGMDRVRADAGSALLTEAPVAPSTTAGKLAGRFGPVQLAGIETALASIYPRWLALAPAAVRARLVLRDSDAMKAVFAVAKRVAIIGAGWTGLETAAARAAGAEVTVIERGELPLLAVLGRELAEIYAAVHRGHGVQLRLAGTARRRGRLRERAAAGARSRWPAAAGCRAARPQPPSERPQRLLRCTLSRPYLSISRRGFATGSDRIAGHGQGLRRGGSTVRRGSPEPRPR